MSKTLEETSVTKVKTNCDTINGDKVDDIETFECVLRYLSTRKHWWLETVA